MRSPRTAAAVLAAAVLATGLAACSSSDDPEPAPTEGSNEVLPPIMVDGPGQVDAKVGEVIRVNTEEVTRVATDNPSVLEVSQPMTTDTASFTGGALVIDAGEATLMVYADDEELYTVEVTAEYGQAAVD